MITHVQGNDAVSAWKRGVLAIQAAQGEIFNLVTTIDSPTIMQENWLSEYSPHRIRGHYDNLRDVIDTVFPIRLAADQGDYQSLRTSYLRRHDRAMRWTRNRGRWGTYFERLIRFPPDNTDQLERAILKLRNWPVRNTTGLVFHPSSAVDAPRTRGGPCWHFGELLWRENGLVDFVVVYRNHDFFGKALGNFLSLGQLLQFICREGSTATRILTPGKLTCYSVHAFLSGRNAADVAELCADSLV